MTTDIQKEILALNLALAEKKFKETATSKAISASIHRNEAGQTSFVSSRNVMSEVAGLIKLTNELPDTASDQQWQALFEDKNRDKLDKMFMIPGVTSREKPLSAEAISDYLTGLSEPRRKQFLEKHAQQFFKHFILNSSEQVMTANIAIILSAVDLKDQPALLRSIMSTPLQGTDCYVYNAKDFDLSKIGDGLYFALTSLDTAMALADSNSALKTKPILDEFGRVTWDCWLTKAVSQAWKSCFSVEERGINQKKEEFLGFLSQYPGASAAQYTAIYQQSCDIRGLQAAACTSRCESLSLIIEHMPPTCVQSIKDLRVLLILVQNMHPPVTSSQQASLQTKILEKFKDQIAVVIKSEKDIQTIAETFINFDTLPKTFLNAIPNYGLSFQTVAYKEHQNALVLEKIDALNKIDAPNSDTEKKNLYSCFKKVLKHEQFRFKADLPPWNNDVITPTEELLKTKLMLRDTLISATKGRGVAEQAAEGCLEKIFSAKDMAELNVVLADEKKNPGGNEVVWPNSALSNIFTKPKEIYTKALVQGEACILSCSKKMQAANTAKPLSPKA